MLYTNPKAWRGPSVLSPILKSWDVRHGWRVPQAALYVPCNGHEKVSEDCQLVFQLPGKSSAFQLS